MMIIKTQRDCLKNSFAKLYGWPSFITFDYANWLGWIVMNNESDRNYVRYCWAFDRSIIVQEL